MDGESSAGRLEARLRLAGVAASIALPPKPSGDWNKWSAQGGRVSAGAQEERGRDGVGAPRGRITLAQALELDRDD